MIVEAPAKLNLCLYVGPVRDDGLHEICSLFAPLGLTDRLKVTPSERDEVVVPDSLGPGPDLTERALVALREAGWSGDGVRIELEKEIPVAAGLGGGSGDAAAALRLADDEIAEVRLLEIARKLGADVASQLRPRFCLVGGAGEDVTDLPPPDPFHAVVVTDPDGLSTPEVYAASDRLGTTRSAAELGELREQLRAAAGGGAHPLDYGSLLHNDLAEAAISLHPRLARTLEALGAAGADLAFVTGSGPTAIGLCRDRAQADAVAGALVPAVADGGRRVIVCEAGRA